MRKLILLACIFVGQLHAHAIVINPDPMNLPFGGGDGSINLVIVGDEPSRNCEVTAYAAPQTAGQVSVTNASPQPARELVLTVHALRQPQGELESIGISGTWRGVGIPNANCADGPFNFAFTVTVTRTAGLVPTITTGSIVPVYSAVNTIQPGEWVSIYGSNLVSIAATWSGDFPTSLGGASVTINGKPAYLWYVSPNQINLQTPDDTMTGSVSVVLTNAADLPLRA